MLLLTSVSTEELNSSIESKFFNILASAMDQNTPANLRISDRFCRSATITVGNDEMVFDIGRGMAPRIYVSQDGEPILLLDGNSDGMGGESYLVLKIDKILSKSAYFTFRAERVCSSTAGNLRCSSNIQNQDIYNIEVSSTNFCN